MDGFAGKVAVVTGAASGIGLALAERFAAEGMKIVLADIEEAPLNAAEEAIKARGGTAMAVRTNVLHEPDIKRLADTAFATWGNVHILCNNAGVAGGAGADGIWNVPKEDWDWVLGVNFSGVLHGIRHFVPRMLAAGEPGHIVNTASAAGITSSRSGPYAVSKHAVVALSERLYRDLKLCHAKVSASVLCPGWVNTRITESARNRPEELLPNALAQLALTPKVEMMRRAVSELVRNGLPPAEVAGLVFEAIRSDTFYIVPVQPDINEAIALRLEDIRLRRNPSIVPTA
jgi:NAD(P)-dependent dehydrogenase (short-subunit alcohol dehydrogenase family)